MTYILLITALALSAIAATYAVIGLTAIFAASATSIMVMGGTLEAAKLVVASWLYRNWKEIPTLLKAYFTSALVILMLLTSMGIFGYLSKAHLDQAVPTSDLVAKVSFIDEQILNQRENIDAARKTITQLDRQVEETLNRTTDATDNVAVNRSVTIRRAQARERQALAEEIKKAQEEISRLNTERQPIAQQVRQVEAEVGPIKYIAALVYGNDLNQDLLETAVRWVIILIVIVFDPLAVLMLIAWNREVNRESLAAPLPILSPEPEDTEQDVEEFFQRGKLVARGLDADEEARRAEEANNLIAEIERVEPEPQVPEELPPEPEETKAFLQKVENIVKSTQVEDPKPELSAPSKEQLDDTQFTLNPESDTKEIVRKPISGRPERYK
jgi:hypothetical protein